MADKKTSEILEGAMSEEFKRRSRPWHEKAWEGMKEVASDIGSGIASGVESISEAGEGVGSRLGPLPGSEKEKKQKAEGEQRLEGIRAAEIKNITSLAEDIAEEKGTTLAESPELQSAIKEKVVEKYGEDVASRYTPEVVASLPPQRPLTEDQAKAAGEEPPKELPVTEEEIEQNPSMKQSVDAVDTIRSVSLEGLTELENTDRQTRDEYLDEIAEAKEMYARTKDEIAQKKIWEALLNGFAALATAWYGNNTGLDLSGVKFSPSDWDSKLEEARDDLAVAKSFAKDVRDVKLEGTEGERTRIIREMQGNKAFNEALTDKLRYEILTKQKAAMDATENSLSALEQQKKVFGQVKGTPQYQVYVENKKALEKTLSDYKEDPSDDKLEELRIRSNSLDTASKSITSRYNVDFPNEYPPYIFEDKDVTRLFIFPGKESPGYLDILAGKSQAGKYSNISPAVRKLYQTYLDNPDDPARGQVEDLFMKRYGIDITKGGL